MGPLIVPLIERTDGGMTFLGPKYLEEYARAGRIPTGHGWMRIDGLADYAAELGYCVLRFRDSCPQCAGLYADMLAYPDVEAL